MRDVPNTATMPLMNTRASMTALAMALVVVGACSSSSTATGSSPNIDGGGLGGSTDAGVSGAQAGGSATVNGTVGGTSFDAMDAVALKGVYGSGETGIVEIIVGDHAHLCETYKQLTPQPGAKKAGLSTFGFALGEPAPGSIVPVGTYTPAASPTELDNVGWERDDSTCHSSVSGGADLETVTLTAVGETFVGTFDITFQNGEHVTGSFTAPLCTVNRPDAGTTTPEGGTCLP